ncbi:DinB family protein [Kitasatospora sp. NBC_00070]|uniref:DinB family protein n=1 Tax=Kitasatospora sp. NBC_00070 TaxID=2975962 RepID=UPI0038602925
MARTEPETDLQLYLQDARDVLLLKLDGLSEYDLRRPMTPTGTNLLGLVEHLTGAEAAYFGETFGRPFETPRLWIATDAESNSDLSATVDGSREQIVGRCRAAWAHSDATIAALPLDALGRVPWGPRSELTLHRILVHTIGETHRHAGHADLVRELVDGSVGQRGENDNLPPGGPTWWAAHRARPEQVAREVGGRA